jgi:hypothetical protein
VAYEHLLQLCISLLGGFFAVLLALWIERVRLPNIEIHATDEAHSDMTYDPPHPFAGRWKFFRVDVGNQPLPTPFGWIPRQAAENCRAKIEFFRPAESRSIFEMRGRWASTPELAYVADADRIVKVLHPDPVTIPANKREFLDVIVKNESDKDAYGWNNEAYLHGWRTPHYKLNPGNYRVEIHISPQNGRTVHQKFQLQVGERIEDSSLKVLQ